MLLASAGCHESKAPPRDVGSVTFTVPTASSIAPEPSILSATPIASASPSTTVVARPPLAPTVGDVTCSRDADCAITTRDDCCDCCESNPRATSRAWLAWRDGTQCPATRCEPCGKVKCAHVDSPDAFRPTCEGGQCTLAPATH